MYEATADIFANGLTTLSARILNQVQAGISTRTIRSSGIAGTPSTPASQDFLFKYDIPSSERIEVLRRLDEYNLNAFSLFDTEETLLETMWFREHDLKNLD